MDSRSYACLERHKPYLKILSEIHNSFIFVAESSPRGFGDYIYISTKFNEVFGLDPNIIETIDGNKFETYVHPDDRQILELTRKKLIEYIYSLPPERRNDYKYIFEHRMAFPANKFIRVITQVQLLDPVENGDPALVIGTIDISPDQSETDNLRLRVFNYKTGQIFPFPVINIESDTNLTNREKEILELIKQGMFSKEISDKLSISIHTVNGHRQNILQKLKVDNAHEAVEYARSLGLIN